MPRLQRLILVIVLFAFSACSQNSVIESETSVPTPAETATPYMAGTQTVQAASSLLPTLSFSNTALPLVPPLTAIPSPRPQASALPVFYSNSSSLFLVGTFREDHGWWSWRGSSVDAERWMGSNFDADTNYDFFSPNGFVQIQGSPLKPDFACALPEPMVGVVHGSITERRGARELSADDPSYVQVVREWLQSQGNSPKEVRITRILQTDMEGDGMDEVLLSASYFQDPSGQTTRTSDYSVVLMRKVVGNAVVTVPLVKDYYVSSVPIVELSYPNTYTLVDALDLNNDGTLEVIVDVRRWEGEGAIVYRVDGQSPHEVMRNLREGTKTVCAGTDTAAVALPTVTVTEMPSSLPDGIFSPVLSGNGSSIILSGGYRKDQGWLSASQAAQYMVDEMEYDFFGSNGLVQVRASPPHFRGGLCSSYLMQPSTPLPEGKWMHGAAKGWLTQQRAIKDLSASVNDPAYIQIVSDWFQSQGLVPEEIHISRILQADIEGDGVDEVLLSASYFQDTSGQTLNTSDYSVVLMRKVVGNAVVTVPLVKYYYVSSGLFYPYTLADAFDFNSDGTLEVLVSVIIWQGQGASAAGQQGGTIIYRVDGQNVREVLRGICGGL